MEKKIVVLVHPGLPYRKTIRYARERARDMGAAILLLSAIPEFDESDKVALAVHEFASYENVSRHMEKDIIGFLERVVQFCLDDGITVDTQVERGSVEDVIKRVVKDINIKLVVVPTPTKEAHHAAFIGTIREFAHNMLEHELKCPVVSVLAT
ncbi:MAG: universal stress protein [Nitrospirae bacterium]|nr:universal stress protein [Nitrospirota bacterium]